MKHSRHVLPVPAVLCVLPLTAAEPSNAQPLVLEKLGLMYVGGREVPMVGGGGRFGGGGTQTQIVEQAPVHYLIPPEEKQRGRCPVVMGDHHNLGGQERRNDEVPIHEVTVDPFYISIYEVTNEEYCKYLNAALTQKTIAVVDGLVHDADLRVIYCETQPAVPHSHLEWNGTAFTVVAGKDKHPVVCIRWEGAAAYCNWLSAAKGLQPCYDMAAGACDYSKNGYRLPTEAEWEYAGRGGKYEPYCIYPWGADADYDRANWPNSRDPYEVGPVPWTTPVGFYNGELCRKADFGWPGDQATDQTKDGANGHGLYDKVGNVLEWCADWYDPPDFGPTADGKMHRTYLSMHDYYRRSRSFAAWDPDGPREGRERVLRGSSWWHADIEDARCARRFHDRLPNTNEPCLPLWGFRCAMDLA